MTTAGSITGSKVFPALMSNNCRGKSLPQLNYKDRSTNYVRWFRIGRQLPLEWSVRPS